MTLSQHQLLRTPFYWKIRICRILHQKAPIFWKFCILKPKFFGRKRVLAIKFGKIPSSQDPIFCLQILSVQFLCPPFWDPERHTPTNKKEEKLSAFPRAFFQAIGEMFIKFVEFSRNVWYFQERNLWNSVIHVLGKFRERNWQWL